MRSNNSILKEAVEKALDQPVVPGDVVAMWDEDITHRAIQVNDVVVTVESAEGETKEWLRRKVFNVNTADQMAISQQRYNTGGPA